MQDFSSYVIKYFGIVIEIIIIVSIITDIVYTLYDMFVSVKFGILTLTYNTIENAFFALVLLELFQGVHDFVLKSPVALRHVIEAGLSYIVREIIIDISTGIKDIYSLSALAVVITALSVSMYLITTSSYCAKSITK